MKISLSINGVLYNFYFDIGYTINLINRLFLRKLIELSLYIEIYKIPTTIKVRGLGSSKYNTTEYIIVSIYIPSKDGITLIIKELYIINNLLIKVLININIIKLKGIIINIGKNIVIIILYNALEVLVTIKTKGIKTNTLVISKIY